MDAVHVQVGLVLLVGVVVVGVPGVPGAVAPYVTVLSVLVEAAFPLPAASAAEFATMVALTVPLEVMPLTATL